MTHFNARRTADRNVNIIKMIREGKKYREVADTYKVSYQRIGQIWKAHMLKLRHEREEADRKALENTA